MRFRIGHEQKWLIILIFVAVLFFFVSGISIAFSFSVWFLFADIAVMIISMLLFFLEKIIGTSLIVGKDTLTIKYILHRKTIAFSKIRDLNIEPYKRMRRRGGGAAVHEYRMKMTITLSDGEEIILTDNAEKRGFSVGEPDKLPLDEVPLYRAYTAISSMRARYTSDHKQ